jgi:hypothetical protein
MFQKQESNMSDRPPQTLDDWPGLFYHQVTDVGMVALMETVRTAALETGEAILACCPQDRYRSLAMTALEEVVLRAIQSLAVKDPATKRRPGVQGG